jgi:Tol biopolymer transport system component
MTQAGTILGTAAYMSPEQAKGRAVDRRADIWSFGVILLEMLTGVSPFADETVSETVAAVLMRPIDLSSLPPSCPPSLRLLLERCLERDPQKRLRDIGEARIHLQDPGTASILSGSVPASASRAAATLPAGTRPWLPWSLVGALSVALVALLLRGGLGPDGTSDRPLIYSALEAPEGSGFHLAGTNPAAVAFSPDGSRLVYGARQSSATQELWMRELSSPEARKLPGTAGASYQFWSPNGQSLGFYANGSLHVMDLVTETRRTVASSVSGKGGCWLEGDQLLFTASSNTPISRLDLTTDETTVITDLAAEPQANSHRHPRRLGSTTFLFAARLEDPGSGAPVAVMVGSLDGSPARELVRADAQAEYAEGHLLYLSESNLIARPLDSETLDFTGPPLTLATDVGRIPGAALALFSCSDRGDLVFHPGHNATLSGRLAWFDPRGERLGEVTEMAGMGFFDLSPDGRRVAAEIWEDRTGLSDIWIYDLESSVPARLTFESASERMPVWDPEGRTLYYRGGAAGDATLMAIEPDSRTEPRMILTMEELRALTDVSPDGEWLAISVDDSVSGADQAYLVRIDGSGEPVRVDPTAEESNNARFSPDGRWVAYALADGGQWSIYLKTNPPTQRKWQLNDQNAYWYDWAPTSDRIYFQWAGSELFVTDLDLRGTTPRIGQTRVAIDQFPTPVTDLHDFEISADGEKFFVTDAGGADDARPLRLVLNWTQLLQQTAGSR